MFQLQDADKNMKGISDRDIEKPMLLEGISINQNELDNETMVETIN
jgi:hypothetical protein